MSLVNLIILIKSLFIRLSSNLRGRGSNPRGSYLGNPKPGFVFFGAVTFGDITQIVKFFFSAGTPNFTSVH